MNKRNSKSPKLVADWKRLMSTFIRPENEESKETLIKYMEQILFGLHDFLSKHVGITEEIGLKELSDNFSDTQISEEPEKKLAEVIIDIIQEIAPQAVNVASPYFIGHMTSAIPFFMVHLKTIVTALNQNVVKLETSKVVSVLEKQIIAKIHRLIYNMDEDFYNQHVQNVNTTLGSFTEGGTLANLTALWVARNSLFPPKDNFKGIEEEGIYAAYRAYDIDRVVILVSRLGHYSLRKSTGVLGIGNENVIPINIDNKKHIDLSELIEAIKFFTKKGSRTKIAAIVGIGGATETGTVDPLYQLGEICSEYNIYYHVDAAWGGPTLMSPKYRHILKGIELADSVTIDGHKQFYMPMSSGMIYFKDPTKLDSIAYHSNYVNRLGSVDLGIKSLAGSREANSLILDSAIKIMGSKGYALLIEHGIETARCFANEIEKKDHFEVITQPELNILTYRICPLEYKELLISSDPEQKKAINEKLNEINTIVQRLQRASGKSFVSRTKIKVKSISDDEIVVLRAVLMNPMTNKKILLEIIDEQERIYNETFLKKRTSSNFPNQLITDQFF
ncbi:MAG: putative pyridoxal-dependent aspartate 1-decarboxylase [Desulfobacterales bacterium]|nr:putative pyridoxal-dependent aspartate 1-decarboxylase [Desulfobacterales bacterium]